jgi:hypothetical protein
MQVLGRRTCGLELDEPLLQLCNAYCFLSNLPAQVMRLSL